MGCRHDEIRESAAVRAEESRAVGEMHEPEISCHLLLVNCVRCDSTLAIALPGHVDE